jgi:putative hydrolase of the HAD superfamily
MEKRAAGSAGPGGGRPRRASFLGSPLEAVFLDMDDTLLVYDGICAPAWEEAAKETLADTDIDPLAFLERLGPVKDAYWADPERHRRGRLDLGSARTEFILETLGLMGRGGQGAAGLAGAFAQAYGRIQESMIRPLPGAMDALRMLKTAGLRLALLTNGAAGPQSAKIDRFGLRPFFDAILIEGEFGSGKPDARVYWEALARLSVLPESCLMVGDNLDWDVRGAQACGIRAAWHNLYRKTIAPGSGFAPDAIIHDISELPALIGLGPVSNRDPRASS